MLATGGLGQLFKYTTNPTVATGDGIAMGLKAGAEVAHFNYVQFHPTALYKKNKNQLDLLSEAIRGFGAYIVNKNEERFLFDCDDRGELATRDIVSKAIFKELKESKEDCVYLDCRHLNFIAFETKFPTISSNLKSKGFNIFKDLIPIVPAAHYQCGGLMVNEKAQTNIKRLYAIGECAETGLHGANRLASNSLLEALVFAHEAAEYISVHFNDYPFEHPMNSTSYFISELNDNGFDDIIEKIKDTMSDYVNISSEINDLYQADKKIIALKEYFYSIKQPNHISEKSLITENMLLNAAKVLKSKIKHLQKQQVYV